ncbi:helix-turn-helix domain-containing protein [Bacteroides cellulosilyticus]|nr:helix-turn-helix domain-containing protein [Bacteroides cellulosilyticus]
MFAIFVVIVEMILSHRSRRVSNLRKKSPDGHCLTGAFLYWNQWAGLFGHKGIESLGFRGHLTLDFPSTNEDEIWVDSYEVCTFLKISEKTLQRLRVAGTIAYSNIRGRYFYKISEVKRMLEERLIKSNKENIQDLITNHHLYVKERRNLRKDK